MRGARTGDKMRFLGTEGYGKLSMAPQNTVHQLKRILGKKFNDPQAAEDEASPRHRGRGAVYGGAGGGAPPAPHGTAAALVSVVGFDVGNDTSCVALARKRGIDVLMNKESKRETPAAINFASRHRGSKPLMAPDALGGTAPLGLAAATRSPRLPPKLVDVTPLGSGRHGMVALVQHRTQQGQSAVIKQFARARLLASQKVQDKVLNEWHVHSALEHDNIVPLYGALEDKSYVTLVMEAQRADLLAYLDEQIQWWGREDIKVTIARRHEGNNARSGAS
ncbi:Heat shock protein 16 [Tetrabaena socialis]|uniref:Heat shock protein 16 n=1 Tax=Tetrabaena socialis TaxID=47790 RepID=A0A2J7ZNR5_9CHLO|nr:Heat shock protein 16 [Tetrabaena socialis]|eukprot:PNH01905.1 Heat shock protein 16 [Tetrabaena socialis]